MPLKSTHLRNLLKDSQLDSLGMVMFFINLDIKYNLLDKGYNEKDLYSISIKDLINICKKRCKIN